MLRSRLMAGSVLGFGFMLVLYLDMTFRTDLFFLGMVMAGTVVVLREFYALCRHKGLTPFVKFGLMMSVFLVLCRWLALPGTPEFLGRWMDIPEWLRHVMERAFRLGLCAAIFGTLWMQAARKDDAATFESISTTLFGLLYVVLLGGFLLDIRRLGGDGVPGGINWHSAGALFLLATVGVTKLCDVGGYTMGRIFGRHKMIPRISPNKTYEGAAGGVVFAVGLGILFYYCGIFPLCSITQVIVFSVVVAVVGMYGDLAESLLKRGSGAKDAGTIVPGFGGLLDVADSLLVSAPVAYVLLVVMLGMRS